MSSVVEKYDPYFRENPGVGLRRAAVFKFDLKKDFHLWKPWRTNDGRILPNNYSNFSKVENPFGFDTLLMLNTCVDPMITCRPFGGFGMRAPIDPAVTITEDTFLEFDLYYPLSAADKYMRMEIWSTSLGGEGTQAHSGLAGKNRTQIYIRTTDLDGAYIFNLDFRCGYFNDETWFKKSICARLPVNCGVWEFLNIDIHTEVNAKVDNGLLMLGDIKITQLDTSGKAIPDVVNEKNFDEVPPLKSKYNPDNGYFLIGSDGKDPVIPGTLGAYHFDIFVDHRNLKPEAHQRPPKWLREKYPNFVFHPYDEGEEWVLPTDYYLNILKNGDYKLHGHCLAWINQTPLWMRQIVPQNVTSSQWKPDGLFFTYGRASGTFQKVDKETARRIYFNHILYEMRHFMTTDPLYGSSKERGIIPFHSFDVLNADVHESRHSIIIQKNPNEWKTALKNLSWLAAMTDDDYGDLKQHYVYLLYKFAHIAVPNAQMVQKFKANYNNLSAVPEYMKLDNHDKNGCIDYYKSGKPPILIYNDYEYSTLSKAKAVYNMIKELNTLWKTDLLYDGRNLIECVGIQGHDKVSPCLAENSERAVKMFVELINDGLLDSICYSEMDIKQPESAPGGGVLAPSVMNQKQADSVAYQYALFFKIFEKYKDYIDHVIIWNRYKSGWMNSYALFDHEQKASQAYYAAMDPDRFIKGHSYLDDYFTCEKR